MNVTEKKKDQITSALIQVVCVILGLIIMAPVLYCIAAAFMKPTEILSSNPSLFPSGFYLDNFIQALKMTQIPRFLVNSLFVSLVCSVMRMMVASMAAYAFAFFEFKGKNILFYLVLGTMLIPGDATIVTNYMTVSGMGLVNNYLDFSEEAAYGATMAGAVIVLIPSIIIFIISQKQIVKGMTAGAVKG